jgi:hypothetical protein
MTLNREGRKIAGVRVLPSFLPCRRERVTSSRSRAQVSGRAPSASAHAPSGRPGAACVSPARARPNGERRCAIPASLFVPRRVIFAHKLQHSPNRVHTLWRFRGNPRIGIPSRGSCLRLNVEALPQPQLRQELSIAEVSKDSLSHKPERQSSRQATVVVDDAVPHLDFSLLAESIREHDRPAVGQSEVARG